MREQEQKGFESWAIVEVMGHQSFAGLVSEQVVAGTAFVRVDVPEIRDEDGSLAEAAFTKLLGGGSIYAITPVAEAVARAAAQRLVKRPISIYMPELRPPAQTRALMSSEPGYDDDF